MAKRHVLVTDKLAFKIWVLHEKDEMQHASY